ncbi:Glycosyl hydrolase family 1 [Popillia japonica]|uniref:Glycosyl hydrolase family 1 n=1 Tax=Popillia japonica TaxID=7064 RepID=A0AAW1ICT3_POPJA
MNFITLTLLLVYQVHGLSFPKCFKFGFATASYQIEGGWNASGKGPNIWDWYTHTYPTRIADLTNGDVACDSYHKVATDVKLLKNIKADFYRFSISWARIFPTGQTNNINPDGVRYYNELINLLLANNIKPVRIISLIMPIKYFPYSGIVSKPGSPSTNLPKSDYFVDYADKVFSLFGDRVKTWITFNEPSQICEFGYSNGAIAPGYTQLGIGNYMCGRTLLIAHAKAYRLYEKKYKQLQKGFIGMTVHAVWFEPAAEGKTYAEAAEISLQFMFGWWEHPIYKGGYPPVMRKRINYLSAQQNFTKSRLPYFTKDEIKLIKGTADFLGLNHYTSFLCSALDSGAVQSPLMNPDTNVTCYQPSSWKRGASIWIKVTPWGFRKILNWIKKEYGNPKVLVTENGYSDKGELQDCNRVNFLNDYLTELLNAIKKDGCNVQGYAVWTLMDNFEWGSGYTERFGLFYMNPSDPNRARIPKMSAYVLRNIIKTRKIDTTFTPQGFKACPAS